MTQPDKSDIPQQMELGHERDEPPHGPGCKPIQGSRSFAHPGEPRYVCAANCPRKRYHAERSWQLMTGVDTR